MQAYFILQYLTGSLIFYSLIYTGDAIRCYQCSSDQEDKGSDQCGAFEPFDKSRNSLVECLGEDAAAPGTFCYKSIQQGPRGFIWDGRWRTVTRRCALVTERGISWGCDWGYRENGVYWEECYCAEDGCNSADSLCPPHKLKVALLLLAFLVVAFAKSFIVV